MEEPGGFHLIPLPFADDVRAAKYEEGYTGMPNLFPGKTVLSRVIPASDELEEAAVAWISKLSLKGAGYQPDSYPNPGKSTGTSVVVSRQIFFLASSGVPQCAAGS